VAAPKVAAPTLVTQVLPVEICENQVYVYQPNPADFLILPPFQEFNENAVLACSAVIRHPDT